MKKNKEHKKGESTIGKIIYGFLLFMPLFAIGVTCGYVMINKNAYQSYGGNQEQFRETQTDFVDMNIGKTYIFRTENMFNFPTGTNGLTPIDLTVDNLYYANYVYQNATLSFRYYGSQNCLRVQINGVDTYSVSTIYNFQFTLVSVTSLGTINTYINEYLYLYETYYTGSTLDSAFYYAVDKVTESPLFSWATNSVIYTTMNATCTQLSITTPFIPLILSYWLIISVIYFLYDIALMLIWLLHDKIHEMRDSLA